MTAQPMTVLHVEDNADHTNLVIRSLRQQNVSTEIVVAADGEAALDYLYRRGRYEQPQSSPRPQIILLDLRLPKIDGLEVLRIVKGDQRLHTIPVIVLTSSDAERDVTEAYRRHANCYLVKPVGFGKFTELMKHLGRFWMEWNRLPPPETLPPETFSHEA